MRKNIRRISTIIIAALFVVASGSMLLDGGNVFAMSSRPAKPSIRLLRSSQKALTVKTKRYKKIKGFQIRYSRNKSMSGSKTVTVKGKQLNKTIKLLRSGKRYYVRIRTYKLRNGRRVYSKWSKRKSIRIPKTNFKAYNTYVMQPWATLHTDMSSKSRTVYAWYNSRLYLTDQYVYKNGIWNQVRYCGKTYFYWTKKNSKALSKEKRVFKYSANNEYEQRVLEIALYAYNSLPSKYDYSHNAEHGVATSDGKFPYDCSNFTAYVLNGALQGYCPAFRLSCDDDEQYRIKTIVNEGYEQEVPAVIVCSGKPIISKLRPGDLLFFGKNNSSSNPVRHVGLYLGNGEFVHSSPGYTRYPGDNYGGINIVPLKGSYYDQFVVAKRVIPKKFSPLDIELKATQTMNTYTSISCWSYEQNGQEEQIKKNSKVTLLYTANIRNSDGSYTKTAFVKYVSPKDETGEEKYAYIKYYSYKFIEWMPPEPDDPDNPDNPDDPENPGNTDGPENSTNEITDADIQG